MRITHGLIITSDGGDYSAINLRLINNAGDDLTLGSGGNSEPYDFSGLIVPTGYVLKIYNNSVNDITVILPQGVPTVQRSDGGQVTIQQPQATTDVSVLNLQSSYVYLEDNQGNQADYKANITGNYFFPIPATATGVWKIVIDRQGFRRRTDNITVDGNPKEFGGVLTQLRNFDNTPKYTGTSSAGITVNVPAQRIDLDGGNHEAQTIFDMVQDAAVTADGMANAEIDLIDFAITSFGADFNLNTWQFRYRTGGTGFAYAIRANYVQANNDPVDTSNGLIGLSGGNQLNVAEFNPNDISAIRERTDNLPDDPVAVSDLDNINVSGGGSNFRPVEPLEVELVEQPEFIVELVGDINFEVELVE